MRASRFIGQSVRAAALVGVLAAAPSAFAQDLRQGVHTVTPLGAGSFAVTRWVDEPDGFHVVTTVDTIRPGAGGVEDKDRHATVRLSTVLRPGQTQTISVPEGSRDSAPSAIEIRRLVDRVEVRAVQPAVLTD